MSISSFDQLDDSALDVEMTSQPSLNLYISNPSSAASSVPNTDEEDDEGTDKKLTYKERRREAHTQAEKKRRDAIKKGYDDLQDIVPNCSTSESGGSQKLSKAVILQRSLNYIEFLQQQKQKQIEELGKLQKSKTALDIMKSSYEQIVKQQMTTGNNIDGTVSAELKFKIFQMIMEKLFVMFNSTVGTASFQELTCGVINWIEDQCKPQNLKCAVNEVLMELNNSQQMS